MPEFMSLRDFLLLTEEYGGYSRSIHRDECLDRNYGKGKSIAQDLVERYDIAQESYERYGEAGPPVNSKVECLVSGHGGGVGVRRTFAGVYPDDPRFFFLLRKDRYRESLQKSLVDKSFWWAQIRVIEEGEDQ